MNPAAKDKKVYSDFLHSDLAVFIQLFSNTTLIGPVSRSLKLSHHFAHFYAPKVVKLLPLHFCVTSFFFLGAKDGHAGS